MKRFLKKKWHHLPLGIITAVLLACLVAGSAFAAYNFTGINVSVDVDEPLQVQYKLDYVVHDTQNPVNGRTDSTGWLNAEPNAAVIKAYFSAGDAMTLYLRMNNRANSALTVSTLISGNTGQFNYTLAAFPNGAIPVSNGYDFDSNTVSDAAAAEWASGGIPISIKGDAAPGTYTLNIEFSRG